MRGSGGDHGRLRRRRGRRGLGGRRRGGAPVRAPSDLRCSCSRRAPTTRRRRPRPASAPPTGTRPTTNRAACCAISTCRGVRRSSRRRSTGAARGSAAPPRSNAMGAIRGTPDDYDRWVERARLRRLGLAGDARRRSSRVEDDVDYGGDGLHGRGGPIPLRRLPFDELAPVDRAVRAALSDLGYPTLRRLPRCRVRPASAAGRSPGGTDVGSPPTTPTSSQPGRGPTSSCGVTCIVDRVLLDGRRAVGVRTAAGEEIEAAEVVVSAGAIHSPAHAAALGDRRRRRPARRRQPQGPRHGRLRAGPEAGGSTCVDGRPGHRLGAALHAPASPTAGRTTCRCSGSTPSERPTTGLAWASAASSGDASVLPGRGPAALPRTPSTTPSSSSACSPTSATASACVTRVRRMIEIVPARPPSTAITDRVDGSSRVARRSSTPTRPSTTGWPPRSATTSTPSAPAGWAARTTTAAVVDLDCAVRGYEGVRVVDASVIHVAGRAPELGVRGDGDDDDRGDATPVEGVGRNHDDGPAVAGCRADRCAEVGPVDVAAGDHQASRTAAACAAARPGSSRESCSP